jgi:hypothetical protein
MRGRHPVTNDSRFLGVCSGYALQNYDERRCKKVSVQADTARPSLWLASWVLSLHTFMLANGKAMNYCSREQMGKNNGAKV